MPKRNLFGKLEQYFIFFALIRCTIKLTNKYDLLNGMSLHFASLFYKTPPIPPSTILLLANISQGNAKR